MITASEPLFYIHLSFYTAPRMCYTSFQGCDEMNIDEQKTRFLGICRETIHREGLEELLDWLLKADFFTAPASTRYHGAL